MKKKTVCSPIALLGSLLLPLGFFPLTAVQAQEIIRPAGLSGSYAAQVGFVPPADDGAPRNTRGGASRQPIHASCAGVPLLPKSGLALTTEEQLSLYLYFAKGSTVNQAIVSVTAADGSEYYETLVSLPAEKFVENGGVIEVEVPDTLPALTTDEEYSWSMVLVCDGESRSRPDSPVLTGAVRRVVPIVEAQATGLTLAEKAEIYGNAGLWNDLLSTLVLMQVENPDDVQVLEQWAETLRSVGLDAVVEAVLITTT